MPTVKVVLNRCHGGFSLSEAAYAHLGLMWDGHGYLYGTRFDDLTQWQQRTHPEIVAAVEHLGADASGECAKLEVLEIDLQEPDIEDYDGYETVSALSRMIY
jgi:hypothetical protein